MSKVSDQDSQSPPTAEDYNVLMTSQTVNSALEFWRTVCPELATPSVLLQAPGWMPAPL